MGLTAYTASSPYSVGAADYQAEIKFDRMRAERLQKALAALKRHNMAAALSSVPPSRKVSNQPR